MDILSNEWFLSNISRGKNANNLPMKIIISEKNILETMEILDEK
jgi:hypothetical protein